jgi:ribosomal protein S18 acetylase RimI-like enzyme
MGLIINKATTADLAALSSLARSCFAANFGHLYAPEHLAIHLEKTCSQDFFAQELSAGCQILLARENGALIGYIKFGQVGLPITYSPQDMELHRLYVIQSHQSAGIGKKLIEAALHENLMQQAPSIYLGVWEHNIRAQTFYASYGFKPVGEYGYHVGPHVDREIILRRAQG